MNKKTLVFCIGLMSLLLLGVALAVFFLYRDVEAPQKGNALHSDAQIGLYQAVPSDAVVVMDFDELKALTEDFASAAAPIRLFSDKAFGKFISALAAQIDSGAYSALKGSRILLSFHNVSGLEPLLVLDAGRAGATLPEDIHSLRDDAAEAGLQTAVYDCSKLADRGSYLSKRSILAVATTDVLLQSSQRHISQAVSVLDKEGFQEIVSQVEDAGVSLVMDNAHADKIINEIFNSQYRTYADFFKRFSNWTAFEFREVSDGVIVLSGVESGNDGFEEFSHVLSTVPAGSPSVAEIVPSYTVFALSLPLPSAADYIDAYAKFAETKHGRNKYDTTLDALRKKAGIAPLKWAELLDIKEVAKASFHAGGAAEDVLLMKLGKPDVKTLFGEEINIRDYKADSRKYNYQGFASALFGSFFSEAEQSDFTYMNGWLIVGSERLIAEYVSGRALENTLEDYLAGAGLDDIMNVRNTSLRGYFSLLEDGRTLDKLFRKQFAAGIRQSFSDAVYAPMVFDLKSSHDGLSLGLDVYKIKQVKTEAPEFERDTLVAVPKGPFKVKNSGTGKINEFYQQDNMYLCLRDENGKGLWGAPFSTPICGCASTIDYFANGKLQILFASGSKLYLIDRLGRMVKPFPVELGKEVLIGPAVYDFSGAKRYNVLVLHTDNTVEMYNLKGNKPEQWKGIAPTEVIKGLPERVELGDKSYWAVRTSIETLIYPFYGGEPLTKYEGGHKIRRDSQLIPVKGGLEVTRYDGRKTTIKL